MPYVDPGTSDFIRNLLILTGQLKEQQTAQAQNMLAAAQPGQTLEQVGMSPKQYKRLFGQAPQAGQVLKPHTAQTQMEALLRSRLSNLSPEQQDMVVSSLLSKEMGVPQVTTGAGLGAQAAANANSAQARQLVSAEQIKLVQDGIVGLQSAPLAVRQRLGQEQAFGKAAGTVALESHEEEIKASVQQFAQQAVADPNHPLWKLTQQKLGINQVQALGAASLGMTSLINQVADMTIRMSDNAGQRETAIAQAEAAWAKEVGAEWKISPSVLLAEKRRQEAGAAPSPGPVGTLVQSMTKLTQDAIMAKAFQEGDPTAQLYQNFLDGMGKVKEKNTLQAYSEVVRRLVARRAVTQRFGVPSTPEEQQRNSSLEADLARRLPLLDANFWLVGGGNSLYVPPTQSTVGPTGPMAPGRTLNLPQQELGPGLGSPPPQQFSNPVEGTTNPSTGKSISITYPEGTPDESIRAFEEFARTWFTTP